MRIPTVESKKQHIRIWYEFVSLLEKYKLSWGFPQDIKDNVYSDPFMKYYVLWGVEYPMDPFDEWWKTHKYLFGETRVRKLEKGQSIPRHVIPLVIPEDQKVTKSLKQVKEILEEYKKEYEYIKWTRNFDFTPSNVQIRGTTLHQIHLIFKLYCEFWSKDQGIISRDNEKKKNYPTDQGCTILEDYPISHDLLDRTRNWFKEERPRSKWIPYILTEEPKKDRKGNLRYTDDQLRQFRRYIKKGLTICRSVSKGEFPGKSRLE